MKTFKRTSLPEKIKYNGEIYTLNSTISGALLKSNTPPENVISALKSTGKKGIFVEVLSRNLKGKTDLHGQYYKPTKLTFTN